jgi:hypothetical protein
MLLLTAIALFPLYDRYALEIMPRHTASHFVIGLKIVAGLSKIVGWLLSASALIAAIVWRRSAKHRGAGLAFAAGVWAFTIWTLTLWLSVMAD